MRDLPLDVNPEADEHNILFVIYPSHFGLQPAEAARTQVSGPPRRVAAGRHPCHGTDGRILEAVRKEEVLWHGMMRPPGMAMRIIEAFPGGRTRPAAETR